MNRIKLDAGWKFHAEQAEEMPFIRVSRKNQESEGYASRFFNAEYWQDVTLPHDWAASLPYDADADFSHGHRAVSPVRLDNQAPGDAHYRRVPSVGWYRRRFDVPKEWLGKRVFVEFDGVYRDSVVWINGQYIDRHNSGYTGFRYDLTDNLYYGEENVLAVAADAREIEGWWYEGAGIYRRARLIVCDSLHLDPQDITVKADMDGTLAVSGRLFNDGENPRACSVKMTVSDGETELLSTVGVPVSLSPWTDEGFSFDAKIDHVKPWSPDEPNLYRLTLTVLENGEALDSESLNVGFRTICFDAEKGLFVNGVPVKLRGACIHQDFAGVGTALPDELHEYKIRRLKEMGANAYRSSHNAPAPEIIDACDRLGMLVMDETRFFGSTPDALRDMEFLVRRDRTHPSVLMWSIGNEEHSVQNTEVGARIARTVIRKVKSLDPTRPVTYGGNNGGAYEGINAEVDVRGVNYLHIQPGSFPDAYHKEHPNQPMYCSEETSIVMARGEYRGSSKYPPAYGEHGYSYSSTAEGWWKYHLERPFMCGGFIWTGFDYAGEPCPDNRNSSTSFGVIDLCGYAKDPYYYYEAWWTKKDVLHLFPHWNHREGETVSVWVFSNLERVALFLNGRPLGAQDMEKNGHLEWRVPFEAGVLEAVGYRNGVEVMRNVRRTAGAAAKIRLTAEDAVQGGDIALIHVELLDENGTPVPTAGSALTFRAEGCELLGLGSGDPASQEMQQFPPVTVRRELADWTRGEDKIPWDAFRARSNEHYLVRNTAYSLTPVSNEEPYRDPRRVIIRAVAEPCEERFETEFTVDDPAELTFTQLLFERLEGRHTVKLNGEIIGEGDAKGWPCAFDIHLKPGLNRIEVTCRDVIDAGGVYRGVWLTKQKSAVWTRSAFNGRAMAIVRRTGANAKVTVSGEGFENEVEF